MKVLIWCCGYEQRFAGPYLAAEAKRQGFDVRLAGTRQDPQEMLAALQEYKPDVVFCFAIRPSLISYYERIKSTGAKLVMWYPDMTERTRDRMWRRNLAGVADVLVFSILETAQRYAALAPNVLWMPQYFDHHFCFGQQPEGVGVFCIPQRLDAELPIYDLCFIGSCDKLRNEWLDKLEQKYKCRFLRDGITHRTETRGSDMVEVYAQSKIAINIQRRRFINAGDFVTSNRMYNAMGSGAFFLNHHVAKLDLVFEEELHCAMHDDTFDGLCAKIDYYLAHKHEREAIARNGQLEVLTFHTLEQRVKEYWLVMQMLHDGDTVGLPQELGAFGEWVTK